MDTPKTVTLKGPPDLLGQYLYFAINNILYIRGVYPVQSFKHTHQLGMILPLAEDQSAKSFIESVLSQVRLWLSEMNVKQVTLVITNVRTCVLVEKWDFKIIYIYRPTDGVADSSVTAGLADLESPDLQTSYGEIKEIMRQIAERAGNVPRFNFPCTFDIFAYRIPGGGLSTDYVIETPPVINAAEIQRAVCSSSMPDSADSVSSGTSGTSGTFGHRST